MATDREWSKAFARQAAADFETFQLLQGQKVPDCHRLQFLQMACEKLVKAHLYGKGTSPTSLQTSHAWIRKHLPTVLGHAALVVNFKRKDASKDWKQFAHEVELLAPAVRRGGQRPDNCEYPWEDDTGCLRDPLTWTFSLSEMVSRPAAGSILKLIGKAINHLLM